MQETSVETGFDPEWLERRNTNRRIARQALIILLLDEPDCGKPIECVAGQTKIPIGEVHAAFASLVNNDDRIIMFADNFHPHINPALRQNKKDEIKLRELDRYFIDELPAWMRDKSS